MGVEALTSPTRQAAIDLLTGLVGIPSLSGQEAAASAWLVEQMRRLGYARAYVDEAGNAVGEVGEAGVGNVVVLLGHIDTVPGAIPVRLEPSEQGELLYGRGSVDAKGPLATFVLAAVRLDAEWLRRRDSACGGGGRGGRRGRHEQGRALHPRPLRRSR